MALFNSKKERDASILCGGGLREPPLWQSVVVLACCGRPVHHQCLLKVFMHERECPSCGFVLSLEGYNALNQEGKISCKRVYVTHVHVYVTGSA